MFNKYSISVVLVLSLILIHSTSGYEENMFKSRSLIDTFFGNAAETMINVIDRSVGKSNRRKNQLPI